MTVRVERLELEADKFEERMDKSLDRIEDKIDGEIESSQKQRVRIGETLAILVNDMKHIRTAVDDLKDSFNA